MKWLCILSFLFVVACSTRKNNINDINEYTVILKNADSISVGYVWGTKDSIRVSSIHEKNKEIFERLNKVLGEKAEHCTCEANGFMDVYVKDSVKLSLKFVNTPNCIFAIIKKDGEPDKCYRLTYRMGMYLDYVYNLITTE
jgi:hypothetical protein